MIPSPQDFNKARLGLLLVLLFVFSVVCLIPKSQIKISGFGLGSIILIPRMFINDNIALVIGTIGIVFFVISISIVIVFMFIKRRKEPEDRK